MKDLCTPPHFERVVHSSARENGITAARVPNFRHKLASVTGRRRR
eukprot:SAG31_NODE_36048_length_317_cov_0.706422_1_plen_44_part_10